MPRPRSHQVATFLRKHPGIRFLLWELGMWKDLARWIRGMTLIPPHAVALPHQPGRIQLIAAFTAVIVVEIIVVDLLVPWNWLRILVAVVSIYSIIMLWCLIAAERIRPSYVDHTHIVLRRGRTVFAHIPLALVAQVRAQRTFASEMHLVDDGVFTLGGQHGTDTAITLSQPVDIAPDSWPWQHQAPTPASTVRIYAGEKQDVLRQK